MSVQEEVSHLEAEVSQLEALLIKAHARYPKVVKQIDTIKNQLEAERQALNLAESNLKHMRRVADHVVLNEWVEVTKIAAAKADSVVVLQFDLLRAEGEATSIEHAIKHMGKRLMVVKKTLKEYGQIRPFTKAKQ